MRKLASIQKILAVDPIPNADSIEVVTVLGWKVVVRKSEGFKKDDVVVYVEIDSLFPKEPQYEFLKNSNYRIKTAKFRGQISQGLVLPITALAEKLGITSGDRHIQVLSVVCEGDEVTEQLGITKYEPPIPAELAGDVVGPFPGYVHKTHEPRVQSFPGILEELAGTRCYVTTKIDGMTASFIRRDDEFLVCGHQWAYQDSPNNVYWKMCRKYGIEAILKNAKKNYAIQGEVAGPGIRKNRYGLKELQLFVFNVFDIDRGRHLDYADFVAFCRRYGLQIVPNVANDLVLNHTVEDLLELAKGQYPSGYAREGIVIRPITEQHSQVLSGRASFKVINNDHLLKEKD